MGDSKNSEEEERTVCMVDEIGVNPGEEGILSPLDPWLGGASYRDERYWATNSFIFFT